MELAELIGDFGGRVGLELKLDENGTCSLAVDGMDVTIQDVSEAYSVGLWGKIGTPPPEGLRHLYEMMLDANHLFRATSGATISRDPENGDFYLCRLLDVRVLDTEAFFTAIEKFVNTLETWQKVIADYRPVAEAIGDAAAEPSARSEFPPPAMGSGFIQI